MNRSIVAALALLVGALAPSAHAVRVIEDVENSVELALSDLELPADATGTVTYRTCATCALETHSLTEETRFDLNGQAMAFDEFLLAIDEIRDAPTVEARALAGVFFDLDTERVTRVIVRVGGTP